jgi:hypothetical protein
VEPWTRKSRFARISRKIWQLQEKKELSAWFWEYIAAKLCRDTRAAGFVIFSKFARTLHTSKDSSWALPYHSTGRIDHFATTHAGKYDNFNPRLNGRIWSPLP